MMRRAVIVASIALGTLRAPAEQVTLRGGAVVRAPLVREDAQAVYLDLRHDILRIPRPEILRIEKDAETKSQAESAGGTNRLYTAADAEVLGTAEAARKYAPAIVVVKSPGGLGSGFFVDRRGYLLTNFHVIGGEKHLSVTVFSLRDGRLKREVHTKVSIVATAPFHDLAVLKVEDLKEDVRHVLLAPGDRVEVGETVFAIGNPLGLERSVSEGVISQTERNYGGSLYLQVDAAVNPGNSGGPLFNHRGQVIGVISMKVAAMEGLNFAIPVRHVRFLLDHLDAFAYDETAAAAGYFYPNAPPPPGPFELRTRKMKSGEEP
jgi:serine protease Do